MLRSFLVAFLLAFSSAASAQFGVGSGSPRAAPTSPDLVMPAGKIFVDLATVPKARSAFKTDRSRINCTGVFDVSPCTMASGLVPSRYSGTGSAFDDQNSGSWRVQCGLSHVGFDDPIVWPGQRGRTHLHQFFGNTTTRASFDPAIGNSTCQGGTLNRSGYWSPVFVYHRPGNIRDGEVLYADHAIFYYKVANGYPSDSGGFGGTPVQWPPANFRMISGVATSTAPQGNRFFFDCFRNGTNPGVYPAYRFDHIPTTAEATALGGCDDIDMSVTFPECWDGTNLDVPDHASHIAVANFSNGCTSSLHPVLFPTISLNIHTLVTTADLDYIRLSSDLPKAEAITLGGDCTALNNWCAGRSVHSDWWNGWKQSTNINGWGMSITDAIIQECYMLGWVGPPFPQHSDCHASLLGSPLGDNNWWTVF